MNTQTQTLFKLLLKCVESSEYRIAEVLGVSPPSLSRHSSGLLSKGTVMRRATTFFNELLADNEVFVDSDLLGMSISGRDLVRLARALRAEVAKGGKQK
jgi:hypothetical protein